MRQLHLFVDRWCQSGLQALLGDTRLPPCGQTKTGCTHAFPDGSCGGSHSAIVGRLLLVTVGPSDNVWPVTSWRSVKLPARRHDRGGYRAVLAMVADLELLPVHHLCLDEESASQRGRCWLHSTPGKRRNATTVVLCRLLPFQPVNSCSILRVSKRNHSVAFDRFPASTVAKGAGQRYNEERGTSLIYLSHTFAVKSDEQLLSRPCEMLALASRAGLGDGRVITRRADRNRPSGCLPAHAWVVPGVVGDKSLGASHGDWRCITRGGVWHFGPADPTC